ncbi:MAG: hypothetical protein HPAVJP_0020 [Candidatus Hepatoplasma vulgare]|nr:MAG: hypothetical protein HPAVJP_0020 [Candidatus Hepatoplasma sp.]
MKFKIKTDEIKKISKKIVIPSTNLINKIEFTGILINVFKNKITFETKGEFLSLKAILKKDFEIFKEGKVLVKSKLFNEIISKITDEFVEIHTMGDNVLIIKSENYEYELNLMNSKEFEEENFNVDSKDFFILSYQKFFKLFKGVIFSGDISAPRRILQGVNLVIENGIIKTSATDNTRATILKLSFNDQNLNLNKIIPIKVIQENLNIFESSKELNILFSHNKILITSENFISKGNLIEGVFPNVEKIFPIKFKNYLDISKQEILNLIDGTTVINFNKNSDTNVIKFLFDKNEIIVEFRELEIGYSSLKTKKFDFQGEKNFFISFNPRLLREAITNLDAEKIKIGFNDSNSPFVIFGKDSNFKSLILPYLMS